MGLGLEKEETEIEEGEVQESDIDLDVALSYIGERVRTLLGHFQKDFEGGISYENLGAKFDGYGSFLPSDQGSPSWPHTQSPHENDSPRKLHLEDKKSNSFASPCASPCARTRLALGKVVPGDLSKGNNGYVQSKHAEELGLKSGAMENTVINISDQKVRIKIGSQNMQRQKIAEGRFDKHALESSPTSILQTMTSYPGELVLSPLSEDLINLPEKRKHESKLVDSMNQKSFVNASEDHRIKQSNSAVVKFDDLKEEKSSDKGGNNWASDNAVTFSKAGIGSASDDGHKDITEAKKEVHVLGTSGEGLLFIEKREDKNPPRKRRLNEMCESDHQTEKKARVSKLGGKGSNGRENASVGPNRQSLGDKDKYNNNNNKMAVSESQKVNGINSLASEASDNSDAQKAPNPRKKSENSNGQPIRHPTPNSHKVRDLDAPSSLRKDSSSNDATSALKEAKDLKHMADRLKNSGSADGNGLYFEAALKFLYGASLLESGINKATKHDDLMHSMDIYSSTAKLCEFCAKEYERSKDMAAAALAYKCMEVAYMRVVYLSHVDACRDQNELQKALQIATQGESSSSSASDLDNKNHQAHTRKAGLPKVVVTPQVLGSHVIRSRNRSCFSRVLSFAQNVNLAMEASRKSRIALTAATEETSDKESICSLKKALNFNFKDVESLLWLMRNGMEAIKR